MILIVTFLLLLTWKMSNVMFESLIFFSNYIENHQFLIFILLPKQNYRLHGYDLFAYD